MFISEHASFMGVPQEAAPVLTQLMVRKGEGLAQVAEEGVE